MFNSSGGLKQGQKAEEGLRDSYKAERELMGQCE